jgi:hypothetical protein
VNHKKKPIPPPPPADPSRVQLYRQCDGEYKKWMKETTEHLQLKAEGKSADPKRAEAEYAKSKLRAYLLLSAIQSMVAENPDFVELLHNFDCDAKRRPPPLEYLMFIGISADERSMVAAAAFKLVRLIAYGVGPDDWSFVSEASVQLPETENGNGKFNHEVFKRIVREYALHFLFAYPPTSQMVAAFPIFWNIRYPDLSSEIRVRGAGYEPLQYKLLEPQGCEEGPDKVWTYTRLPGLTPLELYGHLLLFDPAANEVLNREILHVLKWYEMDCQRIRWSNEEPDFDTTTEKYYAYQRAVLAKDVDFLDFLRTQFYYKEDKKRNADMRVVVNSFPLDPMDDFFARDPTARYRVPLNGAIVAFADLWTNSGFFDLKDDRSTMADDPVAHIPDMEMAVTFYVQRTRDFEHTVALSREEGDAKLQARLAARPQSPPFPVQPLPEPRQRSEYAKSQAGSFLQSPERRRKQPEEQKRQQERGRQLADATNQVPQPGRPQ